MKIGRYRVLRELGQGGMARVTLCEAPSGRQVVVKRPLKDEPDAYDRLLDEAQAGARINHPHAVETLDFFTDEGIPHLVVAYVPGRSLLEVREQGPLDPAVVLRIGRQISEALHIVHSATASDGTPLHMVHRDISPSNIVLSADGDACLIDLGIAQSAESVSQRTKTGFLRGKVAYLAPELFFGRPYSPASDLWALGVVLFEAALGRKALEGGQPEVVAQIVGGHVMDLRPGEHIDCALEGALLRLLHPNPDSRVRRASEAAALLSMYERDLGDDAKAAAVLAATGSSPRPAVVGTLLDEEADSAFDLDEVGGTLGATAPFGTEEDEDYFGATVRERPAPVLAHAVAPSSMDRPFDVAASDWMYQAETSLFARLGRSSTMLVPYPEPLSEASAKDRLLHYVSELRDLTHPSAQLASSAPRYFDPWAMDSSPGQ